MRLALCLARRLWGDVVVWGNSNLKDSAEACCEQCRNHKARGADDVSCNGEAAGCVVCCPRAAPYAVLRRTVGELDASHVCVLPCSVRMVR